MKITERIFTAKGAYFFKTSEEDTLGDYLFRELVYQMQDMESLWFRLDPTNWGDTSPTRHLKYRLSLEKILFRLQELIRFLKQNSGPKILEFVCSEIYDFVQEKIIMESALVKEEVDQVSVILTVMNTYFQPEVFELQASDVGVIATELKNAMEPLLDRLK